MLMQPQTTGGARVAAKDVLFPFLHAREATDPSHPDLPDVSPAFLRKWQGTLGISARRTIPYVSFTFHPEAGSIIHLHPNDFLHIIETLAAPPPALDVVSFYGPAQSEIDRHTGIRFIFVTLAGHPDAQALVDRYKDANINWRQFPIFTRTGYEYDRMATGEYLSTAPLIAHPITVEIGVLPPERPSGDWGPGRGRQSRGHPYPEQERYNTGRPRY